VATNNAYIDLICKECNKAIMDEAQKHGFVCKAGHIKAIYGHGSFCVYAMRDHKGKEEGNILWQIFPEKERDSIEEPPMENKRVTLEIGWLELLDVKDNEVCRQRWEEWKRLATDAGEKDLVNIWTDTEACRRCKRLDGDWCLREELPCTVNPYLTVKTGIMGMACMGMGYDDGINQGELFLNQGELF
jgi:hypothetical protein